MNSVGIHQPNYAPWLGYFAKIAAVNTFVFLDHVQMPGGQSYVSRVLARGSQGSQWLTVPIRRDFGQPIHDVRFGDTKWPRKHLATLQAAYGRCPFFEEVMALVAPIYGNPGESLADFNIRLVTTLANYLQLAPRFVRSSALGVTGANTDLLVNTVACVGGSRYVSGAGGTKYQDPQAFHAAGVELDVRVYKPVPYPQLHGEFVPGLTVFDAVMHLGADARQLLEYPRTNAPGVVHAT